MIACHTSKNIKPAFTCPKDVMMAHLLSLLACLSGPDAPVYSQNKTLENKNYGWVDFLLLGRVWRTA